MKADFRTLRIQSGIQEAADKQTNSLKIVGWTKFHKGAAIPSQICLIQKIRKQFRVKDLLDKDLQLRRPITVKLSGCDLQGTGMKLLGPEVEM